MPPKCQGVDCSIILIFLLNHFPLFTLTGSFCITVAGCWFASLISSSRRYFSADVSHLPVITDLDVKNAFKDLMAASWDELPDAVLHDAKAALSKATEDKAGQEALANVFRSAEATEKFAGVLVSLRMELDDSIGLSGEVCQSYCLFLIEIYQYIHHYFHLNLPGCRFQDIHLLESSLNMNWWLNFRSCPFVL